MAGTEIADRLSHHPLEQPGEMTRTDEAHPLADILDGGISGQEQALGLLKTDGIQVFDESDPRFTLEQFAEVGTVHVAQSRHILQGDVCSIVFQQVQFHHHDLPAVTMQLVDMTDPGGQLLEVPQAQLGEVVEVLQVFEQRRTTFLRVRRVHLQGFQVLLHLMPVDDQFHAHA